MSKAFFFPPAVSTAVTRRDFVNRSLLASALAAASAPAWLRGQNLNSKVDIAVIGAGGKGSVDTDECAKAGANIVALCDVDKNTLTARGAKYPQAKLFADYRKLYAEMGKSFDAVIVATPDHVHAPAASLAMKMGKHAFVQKPLTHSVAEARHLRTLAREKKIATQMGNQGSAGDGLRRAVEVIQAGLIGQPTELHVWSNRPVWPQGLDRPVGSDPVPAHLDWDLWLGPAPFRPYKGADETTDKSGKKSRAGKGPYHSFNWRGWKDFGTGALGDMACHTVNMPFRALKLGYPTVVEAEEVSDNHAETYAKSSRIRFEFPARDGLPPLKFWWYDGNPSDQTIAPLRPHNDLTADIRTLKTTLPTSGCLVIGDKGRLFSADDYGSTFFMRLNDERAMKSHKDHGAVAAIPENWTKSPGHYQEFVEACKGGPTPYSNFDIAAYLTEIILLGCIAVRVGVGKRLDWDGPNMKAKNMDVAHLVKRNYRPGWTL